MLSCTRCLLTARQTCPWWMNEPHAPADEAASMSASSSTTSGLLPPSSRMTRLRPRPAPSPTFRPVAVEPGKEIMRTFGSSTIACPTSAPPAITWSTPSGSPASSKIRAVSTPPLTGVLGSALRITAFPSASAGPTERAGSTSGKFHGQITPTTPTGTRRAMLRRPGMAVGSSWPSGCAIRAAAMSNCPIVADTSLSALGGIPPPSRTSQRTSSARWRSTSSAARRTTATRSPIGVAAHSRWARAADAAALATVSALPAPAVPRISPVAGSVLSMVSGASTQPSLKMRPDQAASSASRASSVVWSVTPMLISRLLVREALGDISLIDMTSSPEDGQSGREAGAERGATVRDLAFEVMREHGLTTVFANPGSTEVPFLGGLPGDMRFVLGLHEGSVVGMATGWAIARGEAAFVLVHTTAGLGNAVAALATARANRAPLVVLVGQQDRRHLAQEPFLAGRLEGLAGDYPVWVHQPACAQDVPGALARARHEAESAGGPALVIVPMDDWLAPVPEGHEVAAPARAPRGCAPDRDAIDRLAALLEEAQAPALVVGAGAR